MTWQVRSSGLLAGIVVLTAMIGARVGALQQPVMITQPSDWVPMTFEIRVVPAGNEANALSYTEYRSSDGSVRFEAHDGKEVQLHNRRKGVYYHYFNGEWTERPLRAQAFGGRPFEQLRSDRVKLVSTNDPRVQGVLGVGTALTFYEQSLGPDSSIVCPELNMLRVFFRAGKRELRVTALTLGEPSVSYDPPSNVTPTKVDRPGGRGTATAENIREVTERKLAEQNGQR